MNINLQSIVVGVIILAAAIYLGRALYRQFVLGKPNCHCGSDSCPVEKRKD